MQSLFEPGINPEELSPLVLAYIGDAVYELLIRQGLARQGPDKMNRIHKEAVKYVRAETQARILEALQERLSPEEQDVVRRGRNAKSGHSPKNASVIDYRYSTGFESLVGYLYFTGNQERLKEIIALADQVVRENKK